MGRGTEITMYLKEDAHEFLQQDKLEDLVRRHSEFITFPIQIYKKTQEVVEEEEEEDAEVDGEDKDKDTDSDEVEVEEEEEEKTPTKTERVRPSYYMNPPYQVNFAWKIAFACL